MSFVLSGTTTPGQSRTGSKGNEGVLHISQRFKTKALPSDSLMSYPEYSGGGVLLFCRDAVGVFYSPSQI